MPEEREPREWTIYVCPSCGQRVRDSFNRETGTYFRECQGHGPVYHPQAVIVCPVSERDEALKDAARYREALEFYAVSANWKQTIASPTVAEVDQGSRARAALASPSGGREE